MLDLETLGTGPDAAIVSIGAVKFDPCGTGHEDCIYVNADLASAVACGGKIDASTVMWWLHPDRAAAREFLLDTSKTHDLPTALEGFAMWFGPDSLPVWGNGATFDNVIMRRAYGRLGMECPWSYKHDRCYRTFKALAPGVALERVGQYHHALDDALSQAYHMQAIVKHLGLEVV